MTTIGQKLIQIAQNCVVFLYIFRIYSLKIFAVGGLGGGHDPQNPPRLRPWSQHVWKLYWQNKRLKTIPHLKSDYAVTRFYRMYYHLCTLFHFSGKYFVDRNLSVTYRTRYCSKCSVTCGCLTSVGWRVSARHGVCLRMTVGYGRASLCGQTSTGFTFTISTLWWLSSVQGLVQRCDTSSCRPISSHQQYYTN